MRPARPLRVVITSTPFAAAVPYSAEAAGPFRTSTFSISSGFMSVRRLAVWPPTAIDELPLSARTPSMMTSGALLSDTEAEPRMRMRAPVPEVPLDCSTDTPEVRP